jgi:Tfp pilus assembly protein PilO
MEAKYKLNIPQRSIAYILMCLTGLLIFLFAGIIPYQKTLKDLDKEILKNEAQIEKQKKLQPIYQSLVKQAGKQNIWMLPIPPPQLLPKSQLGKIASSIREAAGRAGMDMISVSPELNALTVEAKAIPINTVVRGNFMDLRKFILNLGSLPYLQSIEQVQIQQITDKLEFRIRLWLAIG